MVYVFDVYTYCCVSVCFAYFIFSNTTSKVQGLLVISIRTFEPTSTLLVACNACNTSAF